MPDRQMLLDLGRAPSLTREDLIVTDANRDAAALVDRWPEWASPFAAVAGGPGSGKTSLIVDVVRAAVAGQPMWRRDRDLRRVLRSDAIPAPGHALPRLRAEEDRMNARKVRPNTTCTCTCC